MKNVYSIWLILGLIVGGFACSSDNPVTEHPDVTAENPLGLSDTIIVLYDVADTQSVQTRKTGWSLDAVVVEDRLYQVAEAEKNADGSYTFEWLTVKCSDRKIVVSVMQNEGLPRRFALYLLFDDRTIEIPGIQIALEGWWPDIIQLNPKEVVADAEGGTLRATTESFWWIDRIKVDDAVYYSTEEEDHLCAEKMIFEKTVEWLTVKREQNDVVLTLEANRTGRERTFEVWLGEMNYYCCLNGIQLAAETD